MSPAEIELALTVVRGINSLITYADKRDVVMDDLAERMDQARAEGREFALSDLRAVVEDRQEAAAALDAAIRSRSGE